VRLANAKAAPHAERLAIMQQRAAMLVAEGDPLTQVLAEAESRPVDRMRHHDDKPPAASASKPSATAKRNLVRHDALPPPVPQLLADRTHNWRRATIPIAAMWSWGGGGVGLCSVPALSSIARCCRVRMPSPLRCFSATAGGHYTSALKLALGIP